MKSMFRIRSKIVVVALILGMVVPGMAVSKSEQHSAQKSAPAVMLPSVANTDRRREFHKFEGALDIRIHPGGQKLKPPAELLLVDPQGRKVGKDPRTNRVFRQIPNSSYEYEGIADAVSGAPGPTTGIAYVRNPMAGEYSLRVIGVESYGYDLEITGYDCETDPSAVQFTNVMISKDIEHSYLIRYSNKKGSKVEVNRIHK
jgi:hypothetical protein